MFERDHFNLGIEGLLVSRIDFSGGKQGNGKKPKEKIRGSQFIHRQEKIRNIPKPQPKLK